MDIGKWIDGSWTLYTPAYKNNDDTPTHTHTQTPSTSVSCPKPWAHTSSPWGSLGYDSIGDRSPCRNTLKVIADYVTWIQTPCCCASHYTVYLREKYTLRQKSEIETCDLGQFSLDLRHRGVILMMPSRHKRWSCSVSIINLKTHFLSSDMTHKPQSQQSHGLLLEIILIYIYSLSFLM